MYSRIRKREVVFPHENYSKEVMSLISELLCKVVADRIGTRKDSDVLAHPWFNGINLGELVTKRIPAPVVPNIDEEEGNGCLSPKGSDDGNNTNVIARS